MSGTPAGPPTPGTRPTTRKQSEKQSEKTEKEKETDRQEKLKLKPDKKEGTDKVSESEASKGDMATEFAKFQKELKKMLTESEAKMSDKLSGIQNNFTEKNDQVKDEIKAEMNNIRTEIKAEMKAELDLVKADMTKVKETISNVEDSLDFQDGQIKTLKEDQKNQIKTMKEDREAEIAAASAALDLKLNKLDIKLKLLEKQDRKYNLLFYGFEEEEGENVFAKLRDSFINELNLDEERVRSMYFAAGHRIPTKGSGPKPIILRCTSIADRELILSEAKNYGGLKKRVLIDLPQSMKDERSRLANAAYDIRKKEDMQTRIKDRGLDVFLEVRKTKKDKWVKRFV